MDDDNVISMADKLDDGTMQSPMQAMELGIEYIGESGAFKDGKRLLILALDDSSGYNISFIQAGMTMSECLALCEVAKAVFLEHMGYVKGDYDE